MSKKKKTKIYNQEIEYEIKEIEVEIKADNEYESDRIEKRFAIYKKDTDELLDDAQGYGYKTKVSANKAAWYKFKGGQKKMLSKKDKENNWWKQHKDLKEYIIDIWECNWKEIANGETTDEQIFEYTKKIAEGLNINDFNMERYKGLKFLIF